MSWRAASSSPRRSCGAPGGRATALRRCCCSPCSPCSPALSVLWSIAPELTYVETGRMFAYLALFGAAVAAGRARAAGQRRPSCSRSSSPRSCPWRSRSPRGSGRARSRTTRSRTGSASHSTTGTRSAASRPWPCRSRSGSDRAGPAARRRACSPTPRWARSWWRSSSRSRAAPRPRRSSGRSSGSCSCPLRLRSLPVLLFPAALAAGVAAWALSKDPFSKSLQPLSAKQDVADEFGVLVLLMLGLLLLVGAAVEATAARRVPSARARRRIGVVAIAAACLVPLAAFTSVAFSDRGIGDRIDELTSETQVAPKEGGGRVFAASSSRGKYWREAFHLFDDRPFEGVGAGGYAYGRLRYRTDPSVTRHAHGWIPQTAADLGILGLLVTAALGLAWLLAALSGADLVPRRLMRATRGDDDQEPLPRRDWDDARIALVALTHRADRLRRAVAGRLDLVHPRARRDGAAGGGVRGRPRPALGARSTAGRADPVAARAESHRARGRHAPDRRPARLGDLAAGGVRPGHERRARARRAAQVRAGARAHEGRAGPEPADARPAAGARRDRHAWPGARTTRARASSAP